jgi:hypothetical protein
MVVTARAAAAQQPAIRVESFFPKQLPRGQSTVVSVAVPSREVPQTAEISPATDVTISGIKAGGSGQGALTWWELTIDVAAGAAPGNRALTMVLPAGRSNALTLTIPNHVPRISALTIVSAQSDQPTVALQFMAADSSSDLGESPYVWFTVACGGEASTGVVRGTMSGNGLIRASLPHPPAASRAGGTAAATATCDLEVRTTDVSGSESNSLTTAVEFRN